MSREHGPSRVEKPVAGSGNERLWGSDLLAETLRELAIPYAAITPGASFRGLHDSIVNHLGNRAPQLLTCLHEEHAVALAHGWAKVTGRAMAAILHSNVGLMHATMAIFNAWCDRAPVLVLGGTGPVDAAKRRPWIDWIHTARDQSSLVRDYIKWDDQPASVEAALESLIRARRIAETAPFGPTYICLDASIQEAPVEAGTERPLLERVAVPRAPAPDPGALGEAVAVLRAAHRPLILAGRMPRDEAAWADRIELAERLAARVLTDHRVAIGFPNTHPAYLGLCSAAPSASVREAVAAADVVLDLDTADRAGFLRMFRPTGRIIAASVDHHLHNGWSMDHQAAAPADILFSCAPEALVRALLSMLPVRQSEPTTRQKTNAVRANPARNASLARSDIATALSAVCDPAEIALVRVPSHWPHDLWPLSHPHSYLGTDGGQGLASGPGLAVGAALALRDSPLMTVAILGDGDFIMGASALWTAAHYDIPLLVIVANNRSYGNDESHQGEVACTRGRPVENRWIGQHLRDPAVDVAGLARSFGALAFGPVSSYEELLSATREAATAVRAGKAAVVDVLIENAI